VHKLNLPVAIGRVHVAVDQRLERLGRVIPEQARAPDLPFAEYVQLARAQAKVDPLFKRQFEDAMQQYEQIQGGMP
jgi:hypothetical protein